jgi:hypothetical protein
MRTKTVLLTALLGAASIASSVAQTVYSVNAVGYVNVSVPAGSFALLANPLNQPTNTLTAVLPDVPANTIVYVFNKTSGQFDSFTKRAASWSGTGASTVTLDPGVGFFLKNAASTNLNITFVGEVPQSTDTAPLTVTLAAGFNLVGSVVPQSGKLEADLKYPAVNGDVLYRYNGTGYDSFTRRAATWTGGETDPLINVAQGFWLNAKTGGAWTRTFTVQN